SPPVMTWPLVALAVPAVFVGWTWGLGLPFWEPVLEQMLTYGEPVRGADLWSMHYLAMGASFLIAAAGIGAGLAFYAPSWARVRGWEVPPPLRRRYRAETFAARFPGV